MSNQATFMPPAKRRFFNAISGLRDIGRINLSREEQEDVAYTINEIETYGFEFIPNHYTMDNILKLEKFIEERRT